MFVDLSLQSDNQRFQQGFILPAQAQPFNEPLICKLNSQEQTEFAKIATYFQLADDRNKRNFGMSTFIKHLNFIHHFVVNGKTQNQRNDMRINKIKNVLNINDNYNYCDDFNKANNSSSILRGIICGILFGNGFLLVNTDKLKRLTKRSKSCVNGCFQKLGFGVYRSPQDMNGFFCEILPDIILGNKYNSKLSNNQNSTEQASSNFNDNNDTNSAIIALVHKWINPRHWCIRKASEDAPICFISDLPDDICAKYGFPIDSYQKMSEDSDSQAPTLFHSSSASNESQTNPSSNQNSELNVTEVKNPEFSYDVSSLLNRTHEESQSKLHFIFPNLE